MNLFDYYVFCSNLIYALINLVGLCCPSASPPKSVALFV